MSDPVDETANGGLPVRFDADVLVPAVIQDAKTQAVLMVGFMNEAALAATRDTGRVHFWSRSRTKLWRKGETSGHEQIVSEIFVNCDQNSLLISVRQVGAVCHDGYRTCYYRRLEDDDSLTIIEERAFDPATVYGESATDSLELASRLLYGAYTYLRDNDLSEVSGTSARLRAPGDTASGRLADELGELAGALDGSHRHDGFAADVLLESTQVLYWATLVALRAGVTWDEMRPDRALASSVDDMSPGVIAQVIQAEAATWRSDTGPGVSLSARCHAVLALVGQACRVAGYSPATVVEADLSELGNRPYLNAYFSPGSPSASDQD